MGKIFYIMGKSSSGKDTVYDEILSREEFGLRPVVMYSTRPIRANETDGVQYHFVTEETMREMEQRGEVVELRSYLTVYGMWYYFTAANEEINLEEHNYLALGTPESFQKIRAYYGESRVLPIYIEVDDRQRLLRAVAREAQEENPNYSEVCRRYLSDEEDFSEEKIVRAGIKRRFQNNLEKQVCIEEVASFIREELAKC